MDEHASLRIAVVDPGSFVLPYDYHLVEALSANGHEVTFFGSRTRYNGEFLDAMSGLQGVSVQARDVSRSVATSAGRALQNYFGLLWALWRHRADHDLIIIQFCARWLVELPLYALLRRRLIFAVHNPVPHGYAGQRYGPFAWLARLARALWFPSSFSAEDFYRRYGEAFRSKGTVVQHGVMGVQPGQAPTPYRRPDSLAGLCYWSTVKPYKGVELMEVLAQRQAQDPSSYGAVEVHGLWDRSLYPVRDRLRASGARVDDRYLSADELEQLLSRDLVFLLPYKTASQSGALYTLLHHGRLFLATDVGDLGDFLRMHGLQGLILPSADVASVDAALNYLKANLDHVLRALASAQASMRWTSILDQPAVRRSMQCLGNAKR